ncbi:MAG TPA: c-type cytochrome [Polyangiaceae bacterium]
MSTHDEEKRDSHGGGQVHVYDGDLREEDNVLPIWWLCTLYGAIMFAFVYWYGEHELGAWKSREASFQQEMTTVRLEEAQKAGANVSAETLVALSKTPSTIGDGQQVFASTCAACHRADGGGNIGPNLTDEYWLHGGNPQDVFKTVREGVPAKGMPTWGPQLGDAKVTAVTAYVLSLRDTHVAGGKPPQGDKEM